MLWSLEHHLKHALHHKRHVLLTTRQPRVARDAALDAALVRARDLKAALKVIYAQLLDAVPQLGETFALFGRAAALISEVIPRATPPPSALVPTSPQDHHKE